LDVRLLCEAVPNTANAVQAWLERAFVANESIPEGRVPYVIAGVYYLAAAVLAVLLYTFYY